MTASLEVRSYQHKGGVEFATLYDAPANMYSVIYNLDIDTTTFIVKSNYKYDVWHINPLQSSIFEPAVIAGLFVGDQASTPLTPYFFGSSFVIQSEANNCIELQSSSYDWPMTDVTYPGFLS